MLRRICLVSLIVVFLSASMIKADEEKVLDDFKTVQGWALSDTELSYGVKKADFIKNYYKGKGALEVKINFTKPTDEAAFITRTIDKEKRLLLANCNAISFWYKLTTNKLSEVNPLICRLRLEDGRGFDFNLVETSGEIIPDKWVYARIDFKEAIKTGKICNVWDGKIFEKIKVVTFRIDDENKTNANFSFLISDMRLEFSKEKEDFIYKPKIRRLEKDDILKVFLIKQSAAGYYNFEEIIKSFPGEKKIDIGLFRGLHLPIFSFPKTEGKLFSYDLVIMADVDPYVFTKEQIKMLADFVASGGGLLFTGGPNTFGHSFRYSSVGFKRTISDILPVKVTKEKDLTKVNTYPEITDEDTITQGIPISRLGRVGKVHNIELKEESKPLLNVSNYPFLIKGTFYKGRVVVLNTYPDAVDKHSFFMSDLYDDLMGQAVLWLIKEVPEVRIKEFIPPKNILSRGKTAPMNLSLESSTLEKVKIDYKVKKDDKTIKEESRTISLKENIPSLQAFTFQADNNYKADGEYFIEVLIKNKQDKLLAKRDCKLRVIPSLPIKITFPYGKRCFTSLSKLEFDVSISGGNLNNFRVSTRILDFKNNLIKEFKNREAKTNINYSYTLPYLAKGEYKVISDLISPKTKEIITQKEEMFYVVDNLNLDEFYPLGVDLRIHIAGGQIPDEKWIIEEMDDLISHGFNTMSPGWYQIYKFCHPDSTIPKLLNLGENYAQMKDMSILYEGRLTNVVRGKKVSPCVFSPEYPEAIRKHVEKELKIASNIPRLLALSLIDEPTADKTNLDNCKYCKKIFEERYRELKKQETEAVDKLTGEGTEEVPQLSLNMFISDYVSKGYEELYKVTKEREIPIRLSLNYGVPYNYARGEVRDFLNWSRHSDLVSFDIYPYFYPRSQKIRMIHVHYFFGLMRNITQYLKKPLGFYVELDDRNYPFQKNPIQASSECAYTAIGQGTDYLLTFLNEAFGTGGARPERWDYLGRELKKISSYAPLLQKAKKTEAKIAAIFPFTQCYGRSKYYSPHYAYQAFLRGFGEIDVIEERIAKEEGLGNYKGIVLLETYWLNDKVSQKIIDLVKKGGVLLLDNIPEYNEKGETSKLTSLLSKLSLKKENIIDTLDVSEAKLGKGKILLFNFDLNNAFRKAVENDKKKIVDTLLSFIHNRLLLLDLSPNVYSTNPEFEADLLKTENTLLLLIINHNSKEDNTSVILYNPEFIPKYVCDLSNGEEINYSVEEGNIVLNISLEERAAIILALYPEIPATKEIKLAKKSFSRDDKLNYTISLRDKKNSLVKGSYLLEIEVTDPDGRVTNRYGGLHTTTNGIYSIEVPFSINDASGKWQIEVRDRYTREKISESFTLK